MAGCSPSIVLVQLFELDDFMPHMRWIGKKMSDKYKMNREFFDSLTTGNISLGHKIKVERWPILGDSMRDAKFTESTRTLESWTIKEEVGRVVLKFKESRLEWVLGFSRGAGFEEIRSGKMRYAVIDF